MKCPNCGKKAKDLKQPYRPFCSERCKLIDLGKWISEEYRVSSIETDETVEKKSATEKDTVEE